MSSVNKHSLLAQARFRRQLSEMGFSERLAYALHEFVGPGKRFTKQGLAAAIGVSAATVENYLNPRSATSANGVFYLSLERELGAQFIALMNCGDVVVFNRSELERTVDLAEASARILGFEPPHRKQG